MRSIGRDMFDFLVGLLSRNQIFQSRGRHPQRHVKYQLGYFLIRYGAVGSDTLGTAPKLSIGHSTVFLYCKRVCRALRELRPLYLGWPTEDRKLAIKTHIKDVSGFSRCLGSGDGSLIRFEEIPLQQGPHFMTRKKFFGVFLHSVSSPISTDCFCQTNIQATCDHEKRFTSFEIGWPGGVTDVKIFKNSDLWMRRHLYFEHGEYILVDKGLLFPRLLSQSIEHIFCRISIVTFHYPPF
jgi:hypothetical protein